MSVERSLDIIKQALLLEKRGKSFYSKVAEHTQHAAVSEFFSVMAAEEQEHIDLLLKHYKSLKEAGRLIKDYNIQKETLLKLIPDDKKPYIKNFAFDQSVKLANEHKTQEKELKKTI